ncbi:hypothetical protein [Sorangium sp. So ce1099]
MDPVRELKIRADILHHGVQAADAAAFERPRALAEPRREGVRLHGGSP